MLSCHPGSSLYNALPPRCADPMEPAFLCAPPYSRTNQKPFSQIAQRPSPPLELELGCADNGVSTAEGQPLAVQVLHQLASRRTAPITSACTRGNVAGLTTPDLKALAAMIPPPPGLAPPGFGPFEPPAAKAAVDEGLHSPLMPKRAQQQPGVITPFPQVGKDSTARMPPGLQGSQDCNISAFAGDKESKSARADEKCKRCTIKFVFDGIDMDRHADFDLVPRLIGRGGSHMREIAQACGGKVRIRGRGSGHKEQQKRGRPAEEADVPLQIVLSCRDWHSLEDGRLRLEEFLKGMCIHFERYCKRNRINPVPQLYTLVDQE